MFFLCFLEISRFMVSCHGFVRPLRMMSDCLGSALGYMVSWSGRLRLVLGRLGLFRLRRAVLQVLLSSDNDKVNRSG